MPTIEEINQQIKELEQQKKVLIQEKCNAERNLLKIRAAVVHDNLDALLALVPNHSRGNCSDDNNFNNYDNRCVRCCLIQAKEQKALTPDYLAWDFLTAVNITLERIYLEDDPNNER